MTNQAFSKDERIQTGYVQLPFNVRISFRVVIIISIIGSIFYPLLFLQNFYFGNYTSMSEWGLALLLYAVATLYLFLVLPYSTSSLYLRYAVPIAFFIPIALSLTSIDALPFWPVHFADSWFVMLVNLALIGFFVRLCARALWGYTYREPTIHLAFPLRSGCYAVVHGGSNTLLNYHAANTAQQYANDIAKLNRWGTRARGIYPRQLDAYYIFGDSIYSPCDGQIVYTLDDLPDLIPGETDRIHPAGNHVIILYQDRKILLAHLQQSSVLVHVGEQVSQGQPIGKVGNSGNTSEPHLHIHAEYGGSPARFGDGIGVPIIFKEKGFLKRNTLLVLRDKVSDKVQCSNE